MKQGWKIFISSILIFAASGFCGWMLLDREYLLALMVGIFVALEVIYLAVVVMEDEDCQ